ncbi:hypothetical protein FRB94_000006 [Tulasnella sp. JGI-2019a]|nr:hypothetical protein FRB93_004516 [Tulasnella sp. JGI-2019a]KAG9015402.1 hypothetical protein FRB94_000006 [Tulasnella sp. JGI-2019a]KAG9037691.1 hypothetical protein FRB95_004537 [Tulasnella sp. JGI-2019a]
MRRQNTIHDVAALHVHSDGSRTTKRNKHKVIKDALGNVIATGHSQVKPSRRKRRETTTANAEEPSVSKIHEAGPVNGLADNHIEQPEAGPSNSGQKRTAESAAAQEDLRTKRRKQHDSDITFLGPLNPDGERLAPESDFLKTIHYLAAKHYEANGVLYNAHALAKVAEQEKREKQKQKRNNKRQVANESEPVPLAAQDTPTAQRKRRPRDAPMKDMYQAFSGGMLIAMGILIEEDIAFHMTAKPLPEDWEDMHEVGDDAYSWRTTNSTPESDEGDELSVGT